MTKKPTKKIEWCELCDYRRKKYVGSLHAFCSRLMFTCSFPEQQNQPFGGRSVILVGDFGQLPPVIDEPMYAKKLKRDSLSNDGINLYNQFREVYHLNTVRRQSGNSPEQHHFRNILMRLRDGESTIDD